MMEDAEVIDIPNDIGKKILQHLKRDWMIYIVCLIAIVSVVVIGNNVEDKIDLAVEQCNDYWSEQVKRVCPVIQNQRYDYNNSLGDIKLELDD